MISSVTSLAVYAPLLSLVAGAAVTDLRARRIPNWLTLTVALAGLAQSLLPPPLALTTFAQSVCGLLAGFAATFVLYALGGRGAGDVKLTAGIGAWLGPRAVLLVLLAAAVVSLLLVLAQCLATGRLRVLFRNTQLMVLNVLNVQRLGPQHVIATGRGVQSIDRPLPNAVSVLIATVAVVAWL
jgi:prepilin peptidase CpaA